MALIVNILGLLVMVALARTAATSVSRKKTVDEQSSCTERRVEYWAEISRDAIERVKDTRFQLDTKIEILANLASKDDQDDYEEKVGSLSVFCCDACWINSSMS